MSHRPAKTLKWHLRWIKIQTVKWQYSGHNQNFPGQKKKKTNPKRLNYLNKKFQD